MRFCTECGNPIAGDQKFCTKCGTPVPEIPAAPEPVTEIPAAEPVVEAPAAPSTLCTECGTPLAPNQVFCTECGTPVAMPVAEPALEEPVAPIVEPAACPVAEEPAAAPVVEEPVVVEPVVEIPAAPVIDIPTAPVVETPTAPVVEPPAAPVVETPAAPKTFCANCGNELAAGTAFCPKCGKPAGVPTQQTQSYAPPAGSYAPPAGSYTAPQQPAGQYQAPAAPAAPAAPKKKGLPTGAKVGIVIGVVLLVVIGLIAALIGIGIKAIKNLNDGDISGIIGNVETNDPEPTLDPIDEPEYVPNTEDPEIDLPENSPDPDDIINSGENFVSPTISIDCPSEWYGYMTVYDENWETESFQDVWGYIDEGAEGPYFELFDYRYSQVDDGADPLISMWIEFMDDVSFMPVIGEDDAWVMDYWLTEDDTYYFYGYLDNGALLFYYDYPEDGKTIKIFIREYSAPWNEEWDVLPPSYDDYLADTFQN